MEEKVKIHLKAGQTIKAREIVKVDLGVNKGVKIVIPMDMKVPSVFDPFNWGTEAEIYYDVFTDVFNDLRAFGEFISHPENIGKTMRRQGNDFIHMDENEKDRIILKKGDIVSVYEGKFYTVFVKLDITNRINCVSEMHVIYSNTLKLTSSSAMSMSKPSGDIN